MTDITNRHSMSYGHYGVRKTTSAFCCCQRRQICNVSGGTEPVNRQITTKQETMRLEQRRVCVLDTGFILIHSYPYYSVSNCDRSMSSLVARCLVSSGTPPNLYLWHLSASLYSYCTCPVQDVTFTSCCGISHESN